MKRARLDSSNLTIYHIVRDKTFLVKTFRKHRDEVYIELEVTRVSI